MIRATVQDRNTVIDILTDAFAADPYVNWLIARSRNPWKLRNLIEYVVDETFQRGEVWLTSDHDATALWHSQKAERISLRFIIRNVKFFFRIGLRSTFRTLRMEHAVHSLFPTSENYFHLYMIGVRSEKQGKGLASSLIDPVIQRMNNENTPVVLETANPVNVEIYRKKGFTVKGTVERPGIVVFAMKHSVKC